MSYINDKRIVLTLDAGGTNFVFSAMQGMTEVAKPVRLPAWSPPPPTTGVPTARPVSVAASGVILPLTSGLS